MVRVQLHALINLASSVTLMFHAKQAAIVLEPVVKENVTVSPVTMVMTAAKKRNDYSFVLKQFI